MQVKPVAGFVLQDPPVVETALSIQFSDLRDWKAVHHGLYYPTLSDRFPSYDQKPEFPAIIEPFPIVPKVQALQFSHAVNTGRAEYADPNETTLISIQKNRFSFHWKRADDGSYPHYSANSEVCKREFDLFVTFCKDEEIGTVNPVLCEAMYLNQIRPKSGESLSDLCRNVFTVSIGEFEAAMLNRTYVLGDNLGRLYAEINTNVGEDPYLLLKLSSRVRHVDGDVMDTMNRAHDWLIEKFCELTTDKARKDRWCQQ